MARASGPPGAALARRASSAHIATGLGLSTLGFVTLWPTPARAMHLADGILPLGWAAGFWLLALPFIAAALLRLRQRSQIDLRIKPLVAMVAAAVFLLSALPIPVPFTGTCAHPCGTGLAALLVGPWLAVLVSLVALLLQALFLAHGGLTTLGANVLAMGVAGVFTGWVAFTLLRRAGAPLSVAGFAAGLVSDWATYGATSLELALSLTDTRPFAPTLGALALAFLPTQLPLGVLEGLMTAGAITFVARRRPDLARQLHLEATP
jgi:cobalt/nickel transport system permease protein